MIRANLKHCGSSVNGTAPLVERREKLGGTLEKSRDILAYTDVRVCLAEPIPPPDGTDPEVAREWALHVKLLLLAGTASAADLRAFMSLCEAAAMASQAFRAARESGPSVLTSERAAKTSPAWTLWLNSANTYRRWLHEFWLTPRAADIAALPAAGSLGAICEP